VGTHNSREQKKIFEPKRDAATEGQRKLCNMELSKLG
jgi:hypothetical protein